jgi:cytochrome P450
MVKTNDSAVINHEYISSDASHFILAVFYEALRLYPPIPVELKQTQEDTLLPDGAFIPQNSVRLLCTWAMNRSTLTWGDDAKSFRPDRWLHEGALTHRSAAEFPVFQGGERLCLGKRMAELIAI